MEKPAVYHMVPDVIVGTRLVSLDMLKIVSPQRYALEKKKYVGREHIMRRQIPLFECTWSEVIFLTAVRPQTLRDTLDYAGKTRTKLKFFEVPLEHLLTDRLVVQEYRDEEPYEITLPLDPKDIGRYGFISDRTIAHYRYTAHPFLFHLIPHVLYRGTIDIHELRIIEV